MTMDQVSLTENDSESLDRLEIHDDEEEEQSVSNTSKLLASQTTSTNISSGSFDAEKCRAHIANQIKVSKIDRFAVQVCKALEVESTIQSRLCNIYNMFTKRSAQVAHEFTFKCKLGLQRHRQDRILNQKRRKSIPKNRNNFKLDRKKQYSISNDLLYGPGAQLVHTLLSHSVSEHQSDTSLLLSGKQKIDLLDQSRDPSRNCIGLSEDDYLLSDLFEPKLFVKNLRSSIETNMKKSEAINNELDNVRQLFERLASEHRDQVDMVYVAEEERQNRSVIRRSAYNLSVAAFKATSTPVYVNSNNEICSSETKPK